MSENIQSISQGTYTIGQTSATNFVAGPGIKIDEPSAGTVRIGTDETVLFTGDRYWWADTSPLTASENLSNFETIKVIAMDDWDLSQQEFYFPGYNTGFDISLIGKEGDNLVIKSSKFGVNGNQITLTSQTQCGIASNKTIASTNWTTSFIQFKKIIGINRISGGNK